MGIEDKTPSEGTAQGKKLKISFGRAHRGKVKNRSISWPDFIDLLREPVRSKETFREYLKLPKTEQDALKNVGFFVGGHCDGGIRKNGQVQERDLVALDLDDAEPWMLEALREGTTGLGDCSYVVYSTRKHQDEMPRVRVVIPLRQPVTPEQHHALSRILASKIDESMDAVDPISFRAAQFMYLPSVCRDGDWFWHEHEGLWINPKEVLTEFGDWEDHTKLPCSDKRGEAEAFGGKKPEDPTEKKGLIGAFCRVYSVPEAIEKHLSDVYLEGTEEGRYTYAHGSSANGAVVYDGGNFLYSNHATDPAGGHSQNAFDLVRIHKFEHLDKDIKADTTLTKLPSFMAMEELLAEDPEVQREFAKTKRPELTADDFDSFGGDDPEDSEDPLAGLVDNDDAWDWMSDLKKTKDGEIVKSLDNIQLIIGNDPRLVGTCRKNLFNQDVVFTRRLAELQVLDAVNGDEWTDSHDYRVRHILESQQRRKGYDLAAVAKADIRAAVDIVAGRNSFHPVKDYFASLEWDKKPRLDMMFVDYLGSEDNVYTRSAARKFMVAAVARIFKPGTKFDFVPILEGIQGKRKSTFVETLSKGWFNELTSGFEDPKKLVENTRNCLIMEIGELKGFSKAEIASLKLFFSRRSDTCRLAYESRSRRFWRQFVFMGTTNDDDIGYLRDMTGNRRYWPIRVTVEEIDIALLEENLDQLWAEAIYRFESGEKLYLDDPKAEELAKVAQGERVEQNEDMALAGVITEWLNKPVPEDLYEHEVGESDFNDLDGKMMLRDKVCLLEIWCECIGGLRDKYNRQQANTLSRAMSLVTGWERATGGFRSQRFGVRYGVQMAYVRTESPPDDSELLSFLDE